MEILGIIGVFIGILLIIWFSVKGLHIIIAAPLSALVVILANQMDIFGSLIGQEHSYMTALAGFLINNFAIFLLGAILAQYMEKSNATVSIANFILSKVGMGSKYMIMVAIMAIAALLTYGGISLFVVMFAVVPLAKRIFKQMDINWELFPIPLFLGAGTFTMSSLPGNPSVQNAIPTTALGTSLTAAPILGLIGSAVLLAFGLLYMKWCLDRSVKNGEHFDTYLEGKVDLKGVAGDVDESKLPSIWISLAPIVTLIAIILIFSSVANIILVALAAAIVLSAILYHSYIPSQNMTLNAGATGAVMPAFSTSSSVAFGSVLTLAPGFAVIQQAITSIPGSPVIGLAASSALLSGITGSASGAIGIVMNTLAPDYIAMGINPELVHRITVIAAATLTAMPHSGVVITFNNLTGLSIKHGFIHQFIITNVAHLLALIAVLIASAFLY